LVDKLNTVSLAVLLKVAALVTAVPPTTFRKLGFAESAYLRDNQVWTASQNGVTTPQ
jgi:hypothetical protein